jgi:hypothetical protein
MVLFGGWQNFMAIRGTTAIFIALTWRGRCMQQITDSQKKKSKARYSMLVDLPKKGRFRRQLSYAERTASKAVTAAMDRALVGLHYSLELTESE